MADAIPQTTIEAVSVWATDHGVSLNGATVHGLLHEAVREGGLTVTPRRIERLFDTARIERTEDEARERGGFGAMRHDRATDQFYPEAATITADWHHGNLALCLTIEEQQWVMRADGFFAAIGHAVGGHHA